MISAAWIPVSRSQAWFQMVTRRSASSTKVGTTKCCIRRMARLWTRSLLDLFWPESKFKKILRVGRQCCENAPVFRSDGGGTYLWEIPLSKSAFRRLSTRFVGETQDQDRSGGLH